MPRSIQKFETTDEKPTDLPSRARNIGRDAEGATHYVVPGDRVYVVADGEIEREQSLHGRSLGTWVDYVADARGWDDLRYDDRSFGTWLADALAQEQTA